MMGDSLYGARFSDVLAGLRHAFPNAAAEPLRVIAVGFGSVVVRAGNDVIFRVARTADAAAGHQRELSLLPKLARWIRGVALPEPRWHVVRTPDLPFGAIGYRRLPGWRLRSARRPRVVEEDITSFLRELHSAPSASVPAPELGPREALQQIADRELPALQSVVTPDEWRRVRTWWREVEGDRALHEFDPVAIHGDAWYGNLLIGQDGRLSGILDWECAMLGDPAQDLAVQLHLGMNAGRRIIASYGADVRLAHRVWRRWELREFGSISWALEHDPTELEDSLAKWRNGPVLSRR